MERVDGPSMVEVLSRRPWSLRRQGAALAELHHRLHQIPAPDWLLAGPGREGDRLIHLDLHPLNVMLGSSGPAVIDWSNAARGTAATDVALTWILLAAGEVPTTRIKGAVLGRGRAIFLDNFLRHFDLSGIKPELRRVVEWKVQDPNMSPVEQAAMWRVAESAEAG